MLHKDHVTDIFSNMTDYRFNLMLKDNELTGYFGVLPDYQIHNLFTVAIMVISVARLLEGKQRYV